MASIGSIEVKVEPILTISDDTAYTLLGLLEMYCRDKNLKVDSIFTKKEGDEDFSNFNVSLTFTELEHGGDISINQELGYEDVTKQVIRNVITSLKEIQRGFGTLEEYIGQLERQV